MSFLGFNQRGKEARERGGLALVAVEKERGRCEWMPKSSEAQIENRLGKWVLWKGRARIETREERLKPTKEIEGEEDRGTTK
ncbi:hypothetical protein SLE2022_062700 [Rubroshorea leprosula]